MNNQFHSLWKGSLWRNLWNGGLWGIGGIDLSLYNFYFDPSSVNNEQVHVVAMPAANYDTPHRGYDGKEYTADEYVMSEDGQRILTHGGYTQLLKWSEDITNAVWGEHNGVVKVSESEIRFTQSGSYIQQDITGQGFTTDSYSDETIISDLSDDYQVYTVTKDQEGMQYVFSLEIKAGTTNKCWLQMYNRSSGDLNCLIKDNGEYDNDTIFVRKAQVTKTAVRMPYIKTEGSAVVVSSTYSDDNAGEPYGPRLPFADMPQAVIALQGDPSGTAQGEIEWNGRFLFDRVSGDFVARHIVHAGSDWFIRHNLNGGIHVDDGPTLVGVDIPLARDIDYKIKCMYGTHPTEGPGKMQLIVTDGTTTWESSVVDFDGSFDPVDYFMLGLRNEYPMEHGKITILKEPKSWM